MKRGEVKSTHWLRDGRVACGQDGRYTQWMSKVTCRECAAAVQVAIDDIMKTVPAAPPPVSGETPWE